MLILEAGCGQISWSVIDETPTVEAGCEPYQQTEIPGRIRELIANANRIAYVLQNGGDVFTNAVTQFDSEALAPLESVIPLFPPANRMTFLMAQAGLGNRPGMDHFILCETAYFRGMPTKASSFALPYNFFEKGMRRYGGDGLFHQWAWAEASRQTGRLERLISIHLGDHPNAAAQFAGRPIESSQGFSSLDGIPSLHGCGEIDPSIVLLLAEEGMPVDEIEHILTEESGLYALVGQSPHWVEVAGSHDPLYLQAHQLLLNQIIKAIGSGMAVLGGIDAIGFAGDDITPWKGFIQEICQRLEFTGVMLRSGDEDRELWRLTARDSRIQVFGFNYPRSLALAELIHD